MVDLEVSLFWDKSHRKAPAGWEYAFLCKGKGGLGKGVKKINLHRAGSSLDRRALGKHTNELKESVYCVYLINSIKIIIVPVYLLGSCLFHPRGSPFSVILNFSLRFAHTNQRTFPFLWIHMFSKKHPEKWEFPAGAWDFTSCYYG